MQLKPTHALAGIGRGNPLPKLKISLALIRRKIQEGDRGGHAGSGLFSLEKLFVLLSIRVVYRGGAIPIAWAILR